MSKNYLEIIFPPLPNAFGLVLHVVFPCSNSLSKLVFQWSPCLLLSWIFKGNCRTDTSLPKEEFPFLRCAIWILKTYSQKQTNCWHFLHLKYISFLTSPFHSEKEANFTEFQGQLRSANWLQIFNFKSYSFR